MSLDELVEKISEHYRYREFPPSALQHLVAMIRNNFQNGLLELHTNLLNFSKPITALSLNQFPVPAQPAQANAYKMYKRSSPFLSVIDSRPEQLLGKRKSSGCRGQITVLWQPLLLG